MSLLHNIIGIIRQRGQASADTIHIQGYVRQQIDKAIQNAVTRRQIKAIARRRDEFGHALPSVYALWDDPRPAVSRYVANPVVTPKVRRSGGNKPIPPVSSVFDMGDRIERGLPCWVQRKPRSDFEQFSTEEGARA